MKNLKKYSISKEDIRKEFEDCLFKLKSWKDRDVPFPKRPIRLSNKFLSGMKVLGQCETTYPHGRFEERECLIFLNRAFLSGYMSSESLRSTIMHEIVHTFDECNNHGMAFQCWGNLIRQSFGIDIGGTRADEKEKCEFARANVSSAKDIVVCLDCGHYWTFSRKTKYVVEFAQNEKIFIPRFRCHEDHSSYLVIRRNGIDLTSKNNAEKPVRPTAALWLKKHISPESFLKGDSFVWTPERIEQEYWWLDKEKENPKPKVRIAAKSVATNYVQIPLFS